MDANVTSLRNEMISRFETVDAKEKEGKENDNGIIDKGVDET